MHTINLRNLYNLHWSKVIIGVLVLFCSLPENAMSQGQGYQRKHLEYYDDKPIHYGILFAAPFARYNVKFNKDFLPPGDTTLSITSPAKTAFRMGFIVNAFLNDRFDLRTTPSVTLYDRQIKYRYPAGREIIEKRESTWIEIPLLLKYKSERRGNSRMYMLAGMSMSFETNVKRGKGGAGGVLDTKTSDFAVEYGVGYERFFEFFKFAPELRFSHGIGNIFNPSSAYGKGIKKLTTHNVTLYLNFE